MPTRRTFGTLWDAEVVGASGLSPVARTGWGYDNLCIFLSTSAATIITFVIPPPEELSSEGIAPDQPDYADDSAYAAFYLDSELKWTFSTAGTRSILIPDFAPLYFRLLNTTAGVTLTAKWVASGD